MSTNTDSGEFVEVTPGGLKVLDMPEPQAPTSTWTAASEYHGEPPYFVQRRNGSAYERALNSKNQQFTFADEKSATQASKLLNAGLELHDDGSLKVEGAHVMSAAEKRKLAAAKADKPPADSPIAVRAQKLDRAKELAQLRATTSKPRKKAITPGGARNAKTKANLLAAGGRRMTINMPAAETAALDRAVANGEWANVTEAVIAAVSGRFA